MDVKQLIGILDTAFFTGVPDSQLKPLCDYLIKNYGISNQHIIAANEGNCTALAAGYYLATGKVPVVYLQNSGIGNIINPVASLLNEEVYGIPCIFIIGWRGEPGVHDEPQHVYQGKVTRKLLEVMGILTATIGKSTSKAEVESMLGELTPVLAHGKSIALIIQKDALDFDEKIVYENGYQMIREEIIARIVNTAKEDIIVSTTGKASRELFEIRERNRQSHQYDFLTVGSMGHSSSIALGVALAKPSGKVWCIDGDGAALMHMGSMAVIGSRMPGNLIHVLMNNGAHETVGGMPTVSYAVDWLKIGEACGYVRTVSAVNYDELDKELAEAKASDTLTLIEAKCAIGSRSNLGRPTATAKENKEKFMRYLHSL